MVDFWRHIFWLCVCVFN